MSNSNNGSRTILYKQFCILSHRIQSKQNLEQLTQFRSGRLSKEMKGIMASKRAEIGFRNEEKYFLRPRNKFRRILTTPRILTNYDDLRNIFVFRMNIVEFLRSFTFKSVAFFKPFLVLRFLDFGKCRLIFRLLSFKKRVLFS